MNANVLTEMLQQFQRKHQKLPQHIVVSPLALLALSLRKSIAQRWQQIPVVCRDLREDEVAKAGESVTGMAVFMIPEGLSARIVSCDLKT